VAGPSLIAAVIAVICVAAGLQAAPGKASANVVPGYAVIDLTPIPEDGNVFGQALGVNGKRLVVGAVTNLEGNLEAVAWRSGQLEMLGTLGGTTSSAHAVNHDGAVVGESQIRDDAAVRAFVTRGDAMVDLGTLGGASSWGRDIDDRGTAVGGAELAGGAVHAFAWSGTGLEDLGTLGGSSSFAEAIGAKGEIVGSAALDGDVSSHAVVWDGPHVVDLGTLGGTFSAALDVSGRGDVVGWAELADRSAHAFRWRDGFLEDLGTLGGGFSSANGINRNGDVVGVSTLVGDAESRGFVVLDDRMVALDELLPAGSGWSVTEAFAIDNVGRIAAQATFAGQTHAVLLVPEYGRARTG